MAFDAGSIIATLDVDKAPFDRALDAARARADEFSANKATLRVDADTAEAQAKLEALRLNVDTLDKTMRTSSEPGGGVASFGGGMSLLVAGLAAAVPLLPVVTGGVLALGGALTAAGGAALGFGAVALTEFQKATKASQELAAAQQKVNDATTAPARQKALEEQAALIRQIGPDTIALAQATHDLSTEWGTFAAVFTPALVTGVSEVNKALVTAMPLLQPVIGGAANVVNGLLARLDTTLQSPSGRQFFAWLSTQGPKDLQGFADALGSFAGGLTNLFEKLTPLEQQAVNGLANMAQAFARWTASHDFTNFIHYVATEGPQVLGAISGIAGALGHLVAAAQPLLQPALEIINFFSWIISHVPTGVTTTLLVAAGAVWAMNAALGAVASMDLVGVAARLVGVAAAESAVGGAAAGAAGGVGGLLGKLGSLAGFLAANPEVLALLGAGAGAALEYHMISQGAPQRGQDQQWVASQLQPQYRQDFLSAPGADVLKQIPTADGGWTYEPSTTIGGYTVPTRWLQPTSTVPATSITTGSLDSTYASQVPSQAWSSDHSSDYSQQVPGTSTSVYGRPGSGTSSATSSYYNQYLAGLNNPANMLPYSGGGTSGSGPSAVQNAMSALITAEGLRIGTALTSGIASGVNPLTGIFANLSSELTGKAQTAATALDQAFSSALQYGQQAAASLLPNVATGLPQTGSITNVTFDAQGNMISTPVSGAASGLQLTLGADQRFVADVAAAKKAGLSGTILDQFIAAGPSSDAQLAGILAGGSGTVGQVNSLYGQIASLATGYGSSVAGDRYGSQLVALQEQLITVIQQQLPASIAAQVGPAVAAALNGLAKSAQLAAASTPSKGTVGR